MSTVPPTVSSRTSFQSSRTNRPWTGPEASGFPSGSTETTLSVKGLSFVTKYSESSDLASAVSFAPSIWEEENTSRESRFEMAWRSMSSTVATTSYE